MSTGTPEAKPLYKDINMYVIATLSLMFSLGQLLPQANSLLADAFHVTIADIGVLSSYFSIPVVILSPIIGVLCDKIGRKKILIVSLILYGLGGMLTVTATSYDMLKVFYFMRGLGSPGISIINGVLVGDKFWDRRAAVSGVRTAITSAGMAIWPIVGGYLVGVGGWAYPFFAFAFVIPGLILILVALKSSDDIRTNTNTLSYMKEALICFKEKRVLLVVMLSCFCQFTLSGAYTVYTSTIIRNVIGAPALIGTMMSVQALVSAFCSASTSTFSKKLKLEYLECISMICYAVAFILGSMTDSIWMGIAYNAVFGIGLGLHQPIIGTLLVNMAPAKLRGGFMSVEATLKRLFEFLGPLCFGSIYVLMGMRTVYYVAAVVHVLLLAATFFLLIPALNMKAEK